MLIWSASGLDLDPAASPTCGISRISNRGQVRDTTWAAKMPSTIQRGLTDPINANSDTLASSASTTANTPKAPTRESFMMTKARSRSLLPPRPSATSAKPSSWKPPVTMTLNTVPSTAATSGVKGLGGNHANNKAVSPATKAPTTTPTPGKCPALARSMAGL